MRGNNNKWSILKGEYLLNIFWTSIYSELAPQSHVTHTRWSFFVSSLYELIYPVKSGSELSERNWEEAMKGIFVECDRVIHMSNLSCFSSAQVQVYTSQLFLFLHSPYNIRIYKFPLCLLPRRRSFSALLFAHSVSSISSHLIAFSAAWVVTVSPLPAEAT